MTKHNGKPIAPPLAMARNLNLVAHDVVELAELQSAMIKIEVRDWWKQLLLPGVVIAASSVVLAACIPVLLIGGAHWLAQASSLSLPLCLLLVSGVTAVIAGVTGYVGWRRLKACKSPLSQSQKELGRNLRWIKATLKHSAPPSEALRSEER